MYEKHLSRSSFCVLILMISLLNILNEGFICVFIYLNKALNKAEVLKEIECTPCTTSKLYTEGLRYRTRTISTKASGP